MLVLTRRVGESIMIDENIRVTVVEVKGQSVRLGIAAPLTVHVTRQELCPEFAPVATAATAPGHSDDGTTRAPR